ncbi:MAG: RDD family protein [Planctomycetota bacterium]|nr:RDD family protein [Planctomycetota bacterium]
MWHYAIQDTQHGPVDAATMQQLIADGIVTASTLVWREGFSAWVGAGSVLELATQIQAASQAPVQATAGPQSPSPTAADRPAAPPTQAGPVRRITEPDLDQRFYAGFLRRVVAFLIDGFLSSTLAGIAAVVILLLAGALAVVFAPLGIALGIVGPYVVALLCSAAYYILQECGQSQATFGKRALGMKILTRDGSRITLGLALGRYLVKMLLTISLTGGIGFLIMFFTKRRQTLHDLVVDTVVIKTL